MALEYNGNSNSNTIPKHNKIPCGSTKNTKTTLEQRREKILLEKKQKRRRQLREEQKQHGGQPHRHHHHHQQRQQQQQQQHYRQGAAIKHTDDVTGRYCPKIYRHQLKQEAFVLTREEEEEPWKPSVTKPWTNQTRTAPLPPVQVSRAVDFHYDYRQQPQHPYSGTRTTRKTWSNISSIRSPPPSLNADGSPPSFQTSSRSIKHQKGDSRKSVGNRRSFGCTLDTIAEEGHFRTARTVTTTSSRTTRSPTGEQCSEPTNNNNKLQSNQQWNDQVKRASMGMGSMGACLILSGWVLLAILWWNPGNMLAIEKQKGLSDNLYSANSASVPPLSDLVLFPPYHRPNVVVDDRNDTINSSGNTSMVEHP